MSLKELGTWDTARSIYLNVVSGIICVIAVELAKWARAHFRRRKFSRFFGRDSFATEINLVYPEFVIKGGQCAFVKPDDELRGQTWCPNRPVAAGDLKAISYLSSMFGSELKRPAVLCSDAELREDYEKNFVAVGFETNLKSRDAFENVGNFFGNLAGQPIQLALIEYKPCRIQMIGGSSFAREKGFEYAIILKIHPRQFPKKTWIACAGEAEPGTSAAGWFLARKWQEIYDFNLADGSRVEDRPFAAVIKARPGKDQSAEIVALVAAQAA